jgi:ABC-type multidrug transport system fused ATPase/permease subunit
LPSANRIVIALQSLAHAKPAIENIMKELKDIQNFVDVTQNVSMSKFERISLEDFSFKYPNTDEYVLKNVNFTINKGEIIGLKGKSGSGKSTLINLLLGLFDTTTGSIEINETDIKKCKKSWQDKIAYVPQEVVLFDDTLRNNIVFYQDDIDDENIKQILIKIRLEEFSNKLDITIGEGGSSLSGGQKQRIGIARALARKPEFIIFDEATSALDTETEKEINKLIKDISKDITILIIAHKSSALEMCNKVYEIKNNNLMIIKDKQND